MNRLMKAMVMAAVLCSMCVTAFAAETAEGTGIEKTDIFVSDTNGKIDSGKTYYHELLEGANATNTSKGDVYVNITGAPNNVNADKVYKVDVEWKSLEFTYDFGQNDTEDNSNFTLTWDPVNHIYTVEGNSENKQGWKNTSSDVKVSNHSNAPVSVTTTFEDGGETIIKNGVTASLSSTLSNNDGSDTTINTNTVTSISGDPVEIPDDNITVTNTEIKNDNSTTYILRTAVGTKVEKAPTVTNTVSVSGTPDSWDTDKDGNKGFTVGTVVVNIAKYTNTEPTTGEQ